jgi:hypothetical protein
LQQSVCREGFHKILLQQSVCREGFRKVGKLKNLMVEYFLAQRFLNTSGSAIFVGIGRVGERCGGDF